MTHYYITILLGDSSHNLSQQAIVAPVISERELEGMKFGLHREGFNPKNEPKTMQLLVGMEVEHANNIGFDLITHLQGANCQNLVLF